MKKYTITLDDNVATIFEEMSARSGLSSSRAIANLILTPMAEAAAMTEFYSDPERGYILALMLRGDDGQLLSNEQLFEKVKLGTMDAVLQALPAQGQC